MITLKICIKNIMYNKKHYTFIFYKKIINISDFEKTTTTTTLEYYTQHNHTCLLQTSHLFSKMQLNKFMPILKN